MWSRRLAQYAVSVKGFYRQPDEESMKASGKRARLMAPGNLVFEDLEIDLDSLGPEQLYAETERSAVSVGTERAAYLGHPPLRPGPAYPRLMGYCNVARVVRVGSAVKTIAAGQRILTHQSHQSCFACDAKEALAVVPDGVAPRSASLTYLAHLGLTAFQRAGLQAGESVAVQGLGVIGLAAVALGRALGARVLAVGNDDGRLSRAAALGASACLQVNAPDHLRAVEAFQPGGADVVVTTANTWEAWRDSLEMVREHGRIAVLGFPGRAQPPPAWNPFDPTLFYMKQPAILSVGLPAGPTTWGDGDRQVAMRENLKMLLELQREGRLPLERLITHERPWFQLEEVYRLSSDRALVGAVLDWSVSP
jgi:threonine dehydrogenase-like Zn-dependent dehydrogenase